MVSYASIFVHCTYTSSKWQCTCSVHAAYTAATLPVHSTSVWGAIFDEIQVPLDNFGTVVGENPTPYGILALWAVNGLSIVYWGRTTKYD